MVVQRVLLLHPFWYSTISIYKSRSFINFFHSFPPSHLFSFDLFLCLSKLSFFFTDSLMPRHCTCPNKRFSFIFSSIFATPQPFIISSFIPQGRIILKDSHSSFFQYLQLRNHFLHIFVYPSRYVHLFIKQFAFPLLPFFYNDPFQKPNILIHIVAQHHFPTH